MALRCPRKSSDVACIADEWPFVANLSALTSSSLKERLPVEIAKAKQDLERQLEKRNISLAYQPDEDKLLISINQQGATNISLADLHGWFLHYRPPTDQNTPFAKVRTEPTAKAAVRVSIDIAQPSTIVSVYLLMYVPLAMMWAYYVHLGCQDKHYMALVPITLCSFIIGLDLVNQSLTALMQDPMGLTALQSSVMCVSTGVWTFGMHVSSSSEEKDEAALFPLRVSTCSAVLWRWLPAALWYVAYQLTNHEVSYYCSLSERTVFSNLGPIFGLFVEPLVMQSRMAYSELRNRTFSSKMALSIMVFGAVLFSIQYSDFSVSGVGYAALMVAVLIPCRILQKLLLFDCKQVPASLLCCFDGFILAAPSLILTRWAKTGLWEHFAVWIHNPSIMVMLALSMFTFTGNHLAVLYTLKVSSATSSMVYNNIASFVVVFEGIFFFADPVIQAPLVVLGILLSLTGGVWYAVEQQPDPCLNCLPDSPSATKEKVDLQSSLSS
eukprot:CAMPEP_0197625654 /NCGR_PEP_ID=MMETSP1338-20131121/4957_1 /TAXON_ID=43686 ORGANISM="Pelagodinium beii, Strain RCC1491" /NCGR_SAMPLE_ID=MMETSP1338 /ASSEMBLY_ACC=CAM_ASM_000754 /LENGTH=495 /DNA_ID=CAMNT_0043196109 /DNA_START=162 /DNA_END=1650 /DNA_ORIENTATION=+